MKKWLQVCLSVCMSLILVLSQMSSVFAYSHYEYKGKIYDERGQYGDATVGDFRVDGKRAFCLEHHKLTPPNGSHFTSSVNKNERLLKALYYGYDGVQPWKGFKSKNNGIVVTSLGLSVIYAGWDSVGGKNQGNKELGVDDFLDYIDHQKMPDPRFSFSHQEVNAMIKGEKQVTPLLKMNGHNTVTLQLPQDIVVYKGKKAYRKTVTLHGGESFYFEAPLFVTGTYKTGKVKGTVPEYEAVVLKNNKQSQQDLAYIVQGKSKTISDGFVVNWVDEGDLDIIKKDSLGNFVKDVSFRVSYHLDMSKPIGTFKTDQEGRIHLKHVKEGYVYVQETSVPEHLRRDDGIYKVSIEANKTASFELCNEWKQGQIQVIKKDALTHENVKREGIVFDIYDQVGHKVSSMKTNDEGIALSSLLNYGNYIVKESQQVDGYIVHDDEYEVKIDKDLETISIDVVNTPTDIEFYKLDKKTKEALTGAHLALYDEQGHVVDEWTSDGKAHIVHYLVEGKTYTLKELEAPKGYQKAQDIVFEMKNGMSVEMYDDPVEVKVIGQDKSKKIVQTGDSSDAVMWLMLCVMSMSVLKKEF